MNRGLIKNYVAEAATTKRRIVKFGSADGVVLHATGPADAAIGVTDELDAPINGRVDVVRSSLTEVEYGGVVTRGDLLTSDAVGRAVKATLAADELVYVIGRAEVSGVLGDVGLVDIAPLASVGALDALIGGVTGTAGFTIGVEADDVRRVSVQLKNAAGDDIAFRGSVLAYLSDDANGDSIAAAAPSGGVAIGVDGLAIPLVADKAFQLVSEADGDIDLDIEEATAKSFYLVIVLPNGALAVSAAITFAGA